MDFPTVVLWDALLVDLTVALMVVPLVAQLVALMAVRSADERDLQSVDYLVP